MPKVNLLRHFFFKGREKRFGAEHSASIQVPEANLYSLQYGKNGFHTEYLGYILAEMQHLPLLYPDASW